MVNAGRDIPKNPFDSPSDYAKIKVGLKTLTDVLVNVGSYKKLNNQFGDKNFVLDVMHRANLNSMAEISDFYYMVSGIYARLCKYLAYMYRYDWIITPYVIDDKIKPEKVIEGFDKASAYLDNFYPKKFFGETALKVIRHGCYYGYIIRKGDKVGVQELPPRYCRSRYTTSDGFPIVEFNMRYFDETFKDIEQRMRIIDLFPLEFKKGYLAYKQGKLQPEFAGDTSGWYVLDPNCGVKFNINGEDFPFLMSVIPAIIDLNETEALDRKKMEQELLKIVIQKLPIDKNGDLVFDVDEAQELHNNAVTMLSNTIGVNVLTTFAEVSVEDVADNSAETGTDDLVKAKNTVYDEAGVSQKQFNTDGNMALEKSILNDEASLTNLIQQFEIFLNRLLYPFNTKPKKILYKAQILQTTIYNYKDLAKLYKEQTQLGYSKMLPQVALGQSQSSVLATAYFENDILDLVNTFIPPMSSNTMSAAVLQDRNNTRTNKNTTKKIPTEKGQAGRPEKADDQKSEKTIKNLESQS